MGASTHDDHRVAAPQAWSVSISSLTWASCLAYLLSRQRRPDDGVSKSTTPTSFFCINKYGFGDVAGHKNTIIMELTRRQLVALAHLVAAMMAADGKLKEQEALAFFMFGVLKEFVEDEQKVLSEVANMDSSEAVSIIRNLDEEQKREVTAYLRMHVAHSIPDTGVAMWRLISQLCNLPRMNTDQAIEILSIRMSISKKLYQV